LVDGELYSGDKFIKILGKKDLYPNSKEEALEYAKLIVFSRGDFLEKELEVNLKKDYYEIIVIVVENPKRRNKMRKKN
jgi:hypothetical protein